MKTTVTTMDLYVSKSAAKLIWLQLWTLEHAAAYFPPYDGKVMSDDRDEVLDYLNPDKLDYQGIEWEPEIVAEVVRVYDEVLDSPDVNGSVTIWTD